MNGVSWFEAAEQCCESGGRLGTIQSPAQYNVLKSQQLATRAICKGNKTCVQYTYVCICTIFTNWFVIIIEYWVAGRLVASYEPYEWKYDNRTVVTYYGRPIRRSERTDRDYCLKGLATYTEPELETDRCAYEYTRCALCQK